MPLKKPVPRDGNDVPSSNTKSVILAQSLKTPDPSVVTVAGMDTCVIFGQFAKAWSPMETRPLSPGISDSFVFLNDPDPIAVTVSGRLIFVNEVHPLKRLSGTPVKPVGRVTLRKDVSPLNKPDGRVVI